MENLLRIQEKIQELFLLLNIFLEYIFSRILTHCWSNNHLPTPFHFQDLTILGMLLAITGSEQFGHYPESEFYLNITLTHSSLSPWQLKFPQPSAYLSGRVSVALWLQLGHKHLSFNLAHFRCLLWRGGIFGLMGRVRCGKPLKCWRPNAIVLFRSICICCSCRF